MSTAPQVQHCVQHCQQHYLQHCVQHSCIQTPIASLCRVGPGLRACANHTAKAHRSQGPQAGHTTATGGSLKHTLAPAPFNKGWARQRVQAPFPSNTNSCPHLTHPPTNTYTQTQRHTHNKPPPPGLVVHPAQPVPPLQSGFGVQGAARLGSNTYLAPEIHIRHQQYVSGTRNTSLAPAIRTWHQTAVGEQAQQFDL